DTDWNRNLPLVIQARGLITHRLEIGASRQDLLNEQRFLRAGSPVNSLMWMFHNSMVRELEVQLRALSTYDSREDRAGVSDEEN
ncbi:hypothetical protein B0H65DRAFT_415936, partial [Neurospora tetraspora]